MRPQQAPFRFHQPERAPTSRIGAPVVEGAAQGIDDAVVRQVAMQVATQERLNRWTVERTVAARKAGRPPGPEGSIWGGIIPGEGYITSAPDL